VNSIRGIALRFCLLPSYQTIDILLIWKIDNCCYYYSCVYSSYISSSCVLYHIYILYFIHNICAPYSLNTYINIKLKESGRVIVSLIFIVVPVSTWMRQWSVFFSPSTSKNTFSSLLLWASILYLTYQCIAQLIEKH
jgi:hypothetical protein